MKKGKKAAGFKIKVGGENQNSWFTRQQRKVKAGGGEFLWATKISKLEKNRSEVKGGGWIKKQ